MRSAVGMGFLFAACAGLAAPALGMPRFTLSDSVRIFQPGRERAVLYLSREQHVRLHPLAPEHLFLDGAHLGLLPQRSYLAAEVAPGTHCLGGLVGTPDFCFELLGGASYSLRLREVIDSNDVLSVYWLFEEPDAMRSVVARLRLKLVSLTDEGLSYLRRKKGAHGGTTSNEPPDPTTLVLDHIWYENPLDHVNLSKEFSQLSGRLSVGPDRIHYVMHEALATSMTSSQKVGISVSIPYVRITRMRYGGTRFTGSNPWVDIEIRGRGRSAPRLVHRLADPFAVGTYNRLFVAAYREWIRHGRHASPPAADSSAVDSLGQSRP